ncbi:MULTISPECIES: PAS domain-containing sensor histidine kinase [Cellulophaga]|uniref:PAS domain-containing sensor histidine kinase n=1 Tax=Cellulophaga TaxID=104264 RepID=UPI002091475B|nr:MULTISPECIES: PAS domain-containing sensor histidine kinase [Cellulophaga]MDO6766365.1 PAS domain-containing sensor histidine kinase [Cellulophaga sp. 1_MG-2023]
MRRKTENKTKNLIKQLPKATAFVDLNLDIVYVSDSLLLKFECEEKIQNSSSILKLFPHLSKKWKKDFDNTQKGFENFPKTSKYFNSNNELNWVEWEITSWLNEYNDVVGSIIQLEDVTKKTEYYQKFKKLETLVEVKSQTAKIGSWEYNATTDELTWSNITKLIHEVSEDYIPNVDTAISFYKKGPCRDKILKCFDNVIKNGIAYEEKLQLITAKGNSLWVRVAGTPFFENNKFVGIMGSFQDITEEVLIPQKTKESEQLLRTLIDSLPLNVYIKDLESRKTLINKSEADFIGLPMQQIIGKNDFDLFPPEIAQIHRNQDLKVINTKEPVLGIENRNVKKDGTVTHFLSSKIPLINEHKEVTSIIGFSLDITNLKEKESELKKLFEISSLQNKKLVNFAHIISHNLRSHTANFSMLLGFLIREKNETEKANLIDMLMTASDNLLETLDDLNNVVEINTNISLTNKKININSELNTIQTKLSSLIKTKKALIKNHIPNCTTINGTPEYVENILLNVLSNAIKFSKTDKENIIELYAEKTNHYTVITIKDYGLGIDLIKNKDKFFGMYKTFHQVPNSNGAGLYISKNQIEAMNGKFEVTSEENVGTTFKIYFNENN